MPLTFEETIADGIAQDKTMTEATASHDQFIIRKPKKNKKRGLRNKFMDLAVRRPT